MKTPQTLTDLTKKLTNEVFSAEISFLPPSVNKMYIYTSRGPRPSAEMKVFKAKASAELAKQISFTLPPLSNDKAYMLCIDFFLPALYNKGWPGKAKTRFRRRDVSNLIKVIEDLISRCLGIDDSCFTSVLVKKLHGPDHDFEGLSLKIYEV